MAMIDPHWLQGLPGYQKYRESVGLPPITPQDAGIGGVFGNIGNYGVKAFAGAAGIPVSGTKTGGNTAMPYTTTVPPPNDNGGSFWETILKNLPPINIGSGGPTDPGNAPSGGNTDLMKWLLPILAGIGGGLENRAQKGTSSSTATPTYNPLEANFRDNLINKYTDFMNQDPNLAGYEANQLAANNKAYGLQAQNQAGDLAARGIHGDAAALAQTNLQNQNFQSNTQFRNTIPLLARDLRSQALTNAGNFFQAIPHGTQINSQQEQSGNVAGGVFNNVAEMLALMYGINQKRA